MSSTTADQADQILHDGTVILQAEIKSNDVLLGRGALLLTFQGNVLFRKTVQDCSQRRSDRTGGFGILAENDETAWTAVEDSTILRKVKQAFRDLKKNDPDSHVGGDTWRSAHQTRRTLQPRSKFKCGPPKQVPKNLHIWQSTHSTASRPSLDGRQIYVYQKEQVLEHQIAAISQTYYGHSLECCTAVL